MLHKNNSYESFEKTIFVCIDCEMTGLDPEKDKIVEVALVLFTMDEVLYEYETLIDPEIPIPETSFNIHGITDAMVQGKPRIQEILPLLLPKIGKHPIMGHAIQMDIEMLSKACEKNQIPTSIKKNTIIDTLRMARLYGESAENSLQSLRQHFGIQPEGAHRAMSDVLVNIAVFKSLAKDYKSLSELLKRLQKPIPMKTMPLGKHKGRSFKEVPLDYLLWAARKDFDQDLLFSIRSEINRRKKGNLFSQVTNPFQGL